MRDSRTAEDEAKDKLLMENLMKMAQEDADDPNNYAKTDGKKGLLANFLSFLTRFFKLRKLINIRPYRRKK